MKIFSAANPPQAHIVCELLRSHNIECEVRGEGIFGLQGEVPFGDSSEPHVWLFDVSQAPAAQALVKQFEQPHSLPEWQCSECGEINEGQFALCWKCGTSEFADE